MGMRLFKVLWVILNMSVSIVGYGLLVYYKLWNKQDLTMALVCVGPALTIVMGLVTLGISMLFSWIITGDSQAYTIADIWILPWSIEESMQEKTRKAIEEQEEVDKILRKEGLPY